MRRRSHSSTHPRAIWAMTRWPRAEGRGPKAEGPFRVVTPPLHGGQQEADPGEPDVAPPQQEVPGTKPRKRGQMLEIDFLSSSACPGSAQHTALPRPPATSRPPGKMIDYLADEEW